MRDLVFPGTYEDARGVEPLTWHVASSTRPGWEGSYEITTTVRGVAVWGRDWDTLAPDLVGPESGDLTDCVLSGALPCTVETAAGVQPVEVVFTLDLRQPVDRWRPRNLRLATSHDGWSAEVVDEWFEDGVQRLEAALPPGVRLRCCVTCLYSDYSPSGHGLMGMCCHRDAKAQYLAVTSKVDYFAVPVTEHVPETYLCEQYARRIPGTGYRG